MSVMRVFTGILFVLSLAILAWVDWRISLGVFIFGWAMNADNARFIDF